MANFQTVRLTKHRSNQMLPQKGTYNSLSMITHNHASYKTFQLYPAIVSRDGYLGYCLTTSVFNVDDRFCLPANDGHLHVRQSEVAHGTQV